VNHKTYLDTLLPNTCIDQSEQYHVASQLTSITSLNTKAQDYSPVVATKGLLIKDFNADKHEDYIFIESKKTKQGNKARLVLCISSNSTFLRKLPAFPIHINSKPDFQTSHQRIEWKNQRLVLSRFKSEHNWGSDEDNKHYRYDKKLKQFILTTHELISSSGDGLRSDTYELYDFDKRTYINQNQCGRLEEACKNTKVTGKLILAKPRVSLFQPSKPFLRKIPQK